MKSPHKLYKSALVLPGGGAQGAFQVGVMKAISEILPNSKINPFPIISGTSVGAINAAVSKALNCPDPTRLFVTTLDIERPSSLTTPDLSVKSAIAIGKGST